jgi:hypothetical protein
MALPSSRSPGNPVRWTGTGHPPFPCTEDMLAAVLRHVGGSRRSRLDADIVVQLEPWGGIAYVEWLLRQIIGCLPDDEQVVLAGLLRNESHAHIGLQLHHHRNWVTDCVRDRLIPRLVALMTMAAQMPQYSTQTMLRQSAWAARQLVKG